MAKNLITHLEIPLERKHEIIWILVKNNFKRQETSQDIFYNSHGQLIQLKTVEKENGSYEAEAYYLNNDSLKEKTPLSGYEEIEKFIKSFNISEKENPKKPN